MLVSPVADELKVARVFWFTEYLVAALAGAKPTTKRSALDTIARYFLMGPESSIAST